MTNDKTTILDPILFGEFDDLDLLNYVLYYKLSRTERRIIQAYAECGCKYSRTAIKLRSSIEIVKLTVNDILTKIEKEFKIAKQYYDIP